MVAVRPGFLVMLVRALRLRCAWCGGRPAFLKGWFRRHERCRSCGISIARGEHGFELGAAAVNAMLSLGSLLVATTAAFIAAYPGVDISRLVIVSLGFGVIVPIVLYPFSYTVWFAITLLMEPPSAQILDDAQRQATSRPNA